MRACSDLPRIRISIRSAIVLFVLAVFVGCGLLSGSSEQETIAVLAAVLNVFWDTLATADTGYDSGSGTFTYASSGSDGTGGAFDFEWRGDGHVELRFTDYTPPAAAFTLNGVLTQGGAEEFWAPGSAATEGEISVTGARQESRYVDFRLFGELDDSGRVTEDADFHGTIDGASIDEQWGLKPIAVRNHNLVVELLAAVSP